MIVFATTAGSGELSQREYAAAPASESVRSVRHPIRPIRPRTHAPHRLRFRVVHAPQSLPALTEEVLVIQQQLIQAGAGDIDQAQLRLTGSGCGAAAFRDIL